MNSFNEQHFPSDFIPSYIENNPVFGKRRVLTYTLFRFFKAAGTDNDTLPFTLMEQLSSHSFLKCPPCAEDFSSVLAFLAEDDYFSPTLEQDSFDSFLLYAALCITEHASSSSNCIPEGLIASLYAPLYSLDFNAPVLDFSGLVQTEASFYASLYLILTRHFESIAALMPKLTNVYRESYHFTCEDFVLYDFMDEYFETKHCILHPSFLELTDTLVTAVLNYHRTDFKLLASEDLPHLLDGTASKFSGIRRFGSVKLSVSFDADAACSLLQKLFRYAAIYELRNNLFDFHLEDEKLITLNNWKTNLRWHYVQYANVFELAMSSFYAAALSHGLLQASFASNLAALVKTAETNL